MKSGQVLVALAECIVLAKKQLETMDPQDILGPISNALSFIGHSGYQMSLKWRYLQKLGLSKGFQSLCASSTPTSTMLFGDDLSKSVNDISKADKIATKLTGSDRARCYHPSTSGASLLSKSSQSRPRPWYDRIRQQYRPTQHRNQTKTTAACSLQKNNP